MEMNPEIIGGIAATLTTLAYLPQVYKIATTKDTKAISLYMFLLMNIGVACWLTFGLIIQQQPVIWANVLTLLLSGYILVIKCRNVIVLKEKI